LLGAVIKTYQFGTNSISLFDSTLIPANDVASNSLKTISMSIWKKNVFDFILGIIPVTLEHC